MRSVAVMLTLAPVLATAGGCKRCGDAIPETASGTSAAAPALQPATAPAPSPATAPAKESPATELARPSAPWRPSVDCNKLLGAERASKLMGRALVAVSDPTLAASECRYAPSGAASDGDKGPYVDVLYACREAAVHIARAVMTGAPGTSFTVGQQGIFVIDGGSGVVQFLQRSSPCAVQVTTRPADKAVAVAREVERGLAALPVVQ